MTSINKIIQFYMLLHFISANTMLCVIFIFQIGLVLVTTSAVYDVIDVSFANLK